MLCNIFGYNLSQNATDWLELDITKSQPKLKLQYHDTCLMDSFLIIIWYHESHVLVNQCTSMMNMICTTIMYHDKSMMHMDMHGDIHYSQSIHMNTHMHIVHIHTNLMLSFGSEWFMMRHNLEHKILVSQSQILDQKLSLRKTDIHRKICKHNC